MSNSYQNEIPKARVNITLDVDTGGAKKKQELPMKMLMLGDYSNGQASGDLEERERLNINKDNFNQVMQTLSPSVSIAVKDELQPDNDELKIDLAFESIKDFSPEHIVDQVPQLKKLLAMRNILKDLKANVLDNQAFKKELESILRDEVTQKALKDELKVIESLDEPQEVN